MNEQSPTVAFDTVLIQVPFVFEACVLERHKRKGRRRLYRSVAPLELERIRSAEAAYTIELGPHESVDVLMHQDRLIWPLKYIAPFRRAVDGNALQALQDGSLDLFSNATLKLRVTQLENDLSWRKIESNGEKEALALLWRRSKACVVVGDELYAEGGVPILVAKTPELNFGVFVASTGADRRGDQNAGGLFVQPGGFHLRTVQKTLGRGLFRIASNGHCRPPHRKFPRIVVHREVPADPLDLRIDAIFREFWDILKANSGWQGIEWLREKFAESSVHTRPDLSFARCEALHAMLADDPMHKNFQEGRNAIDVLDAAAAHGKTVTHATYLRQLEQIEDVSLATLAGTSALPRAVPAFDEVE